MCNKLTQMSVRRNVNHHFLFTGDVLTIASIHSHTVVNRNPEVPIVIKILGEFAFEK